MTPQPKEHCEHECVCSTFRWDKHPGEIPCIKKDCKFDTRPHTSAPAPAPEPKVSTQIDHLHPGFFDFNIDCDCQNCKDIIEVHDAQVAKAAREKALDELSELINSGHCPPGKNNYECDGNCEACCIEYVRESLRESKEPE